ncbi:MAG: hypothetical protein CL569_08540 [Alphaproteobacteria bacterium]|nr:hypothetical protein [Alphaproteobacteria bacterium]
MAWLRVRVSAFTCVLLGAMATACVAPPPGSAPRQVAGAPEPTSTHVIVRFGTPPTEARLKDLEKAGLRVIEAFDRTTYVARADEALDLASVATGNAEFTVAPVVADSKLGRWLREAEPPPWSRLPDGRVRVDAFFYEDVGPKSRNLALRRSVRTPGPWLGPADLLARRAPAAMPLR